ncbi:MAG: hypothetical protein ACXVPU_14365 [Bacteroidia bacterium]
MVRIITTIIDHLTNVCFSIKVYAFCEVINQPIDPRIAMDIVMTNFK